MVNGLSCEGKRVDLRGWGGGGGGGENPNPSWLRRKSAIC